MSGFGVRDIGGMQGQRRAGAAGHLGGPADMVGVGVGEHDPGHIGGMLADRSEPADDPGRCTLPPQSIKVTEPSSPTRRRS
ncbi:hypothetical protein Vqi01_26510 [Micromonospora qiuiae]|uniref:Uncharacterized protein n=1 Tax=Micromonospora qiuiae TaxID=502268 RepID=A0ABQ4JBD8_9ACTN|nr:hypothetical protein Vqi01_26510 [Micromonospora qiuiae]